ncbi:MAG: hypothetical protein WBD25_18260 [Terriglobales bacterium]|jgi:hypothetical protein
MVRLLAYILLTSCLTAQLSAQASQDQTSKQQEPAGQTAATPSASTQFPLDAFPEFSAVMVGSVMTGDERESHIYRSGNLIRTEGTEGHNFLITDLTTLATFGVSALACMHDSNPYFRSAPFSSMKPGYTVERAISGQETVDGHSCKIEDITLSSPKLPRPIKLRFWEAEDLQGFPVKVEFIRPSKHDPVIYYKNVVLGPQDPTLFIYPKSCQPSPGISHKPAPNAAPRAKKPAATAPTATPQN